MKKYILRIEDEHCDYEDGKKYYKCADASYWRLSEDTLNRLPKFSDELDIEYNRGYQDGAQNPTSMGYEHGYEAAMHDKEEEQDIAYFHGYSSGKHETWNTVKYLWKNGTIDFDWTAEEMMKEYQEFIKKRPEPYEEWMYEDGTKCVVMDKLNDALSVFTENGCMENCTTADLKEYTGRTFSADCRSAKSNAGRGGIMTTREAVNWLINLTADIGKSEHHTLWHYEQALCEIRDMLQSLDGKDNNVPSNGLIGRRAAIDLVRDVCDAIMSGCNSHYESEVGDEVYDDILEVDAILKCNKEIRKALKGMPSAQPETAKRIVGKSRDGMTLWYQCDMCNEPVDAQDDFCRGCGRRLIDE